MSGKPTWIHVLSGEAGVGKTTLCIRAAGLLQQAGLRVAGVVSPARLEDGAKTGIFAQDIRSGERRLLAERGNRDGLGWSFDTDALRWGADVLRAAPPCDVLVVDELGPLEMKHDAGWMAAWDILNSHAGAAIVVVRPSLVEEFRRRVGGRNVKVIEVGPSSPSAEAVAELVLAGVE